MPWTPFAPFSTVSTPWRLHAVKTVEQEQLARTFNKSRQSPGHSAQLNCRRPPRHPQENSDSPPRKGIDAGWLQQRSPGVRGMLPWPCCQWRSRRRCASPRSRRSCPSKVSCCTRSSCSCPRAAGLWDDSFGSVPAVQARPRRDLVKPARRQGHWRQRTWLVRDRRPWGQAPAATAAAALR